MRLAFLCDKAGYCLPFSGLFQDSLSIEKNLEFFEKFEKFIRFQKISGILRPCCAKVSMFKGVCLKDYDPALLQTSLHLPDETPVEKIEVRDEVVLLLFNRMVIEIGEKRMDLHSHLSG